MGTRYGRRAADGTFEYHDTKEELFSAEAKEDSDFLSAVFGFIGLLIGGAITYGLLAKYGGDTWPKAARFGLILLGAGGMAYLLAKFSDFLMSLIGLSIFGGIVWGIGALIWKFI